MAQTVILLVDDEKTVLDSLSAQLARLYPDDVECESAESAEEAWEVLESLHAEQARVVVVVSDWLMPGQRGDDFLAQVRARYPHIGRVLLTGQADAAALERARTDAAVHRILFKPWRLDQLQSALAQAIGSGG
jgi:CheY-like chemotaxis protein